jgi:hypothetical protein
VQHCAGTLFDRVAWQLQDTADLAGLLSLSLQITLTPLSCQLVCCCRRALVRRLWEVSVFRQLYYVLRHVLIAHKGGAQLYGCVPPSQLWCWSMHG